MLERLLTDVTPEVAEILDKALDGTELSVDDAVTLLRVENADFHALVRAGDWRAPEGQRR